MSKPHSVAQRRADQGSSAANTSTAVAASCEHIDPVAAAYVRRHGLAYVLPSVDRVLRDIEEVFLAAAPPPATQNGSTFLFTPLKEQEEVEETAPKSCPLSENQGGFSVTRTSRESKELEMSLMLQLLLSAFTPLSAMGAAAGNAASGNGARQPSSPKSPTPPPLSSLPEASREAMESGGAVAEAAGWSPPTSVVPGDVLWPADMTFATKDAAVKAEVCRCFAQQCERLHSGVGLADSCGPCLRWSQLSPALGGHERLGVAFVFDAFRCWRRVAVPLLVATGDLAVSGDAAALFFTALVAPPPAADGSQADLGAVCSYWCYTLLQSYCRDVSALLWVSVVQAARNAAAAQRQYLASRASSRLAGEGAELLPPPLTCETLLLRSFVAHLVCPICEFTPAFVSEAVAAARLRSPVWAWAEVEELQKALQDSDCCDDSTTMSALLCGDGYWAAFFQPYTAMCAQHYL